MRSRLSVTRNDDRARACGIGAGQRFGGQLVVLAVHHDEASKRTSFMMALVLGLCDMQHPQTSCKR